MTWWVDFHHDDHAHPFIAPSSGATGGSFVIPTAGETSANVWYRINLRVTDPDGLTATTFRDLLPRTATLTLTTSPTGLALTLDGQPQPTPTQIASVVGVTRTLGTAATQTIGGVTYDFAGWSDGDGATHDIATPATDTTYTATFRVAGVAAPAAMTWWFAEGYTGPGFDEYLTILNPNAGPAAVVLTYYLPDGMTIEKALTVAGNARTTVAVHEDTLGVGRGKEVAARVATTNPGGIVVERPMYFRYAGGAGVDITGGHTALGAIAPRAQWWFAEGYTGVGFDQYLAILNPGAAPAPVTLTYYLGGGQATVTKQVTVAPRSRATIAVHDEPLGVGRDQAVAVRVTTTAPTGIVRRAADLFSLRRQHGRSHRRPYRARRGRTGGHLVVRRGLHRARFRRVPNDPQPARDRGLGHRSPITSAASRPRSPGPSPCRPPRARPSPSTTRRSASGETKRWPSE